MTDHPRSPRAKFKVGQVVVYIHSSWECPEYMLIHSVELRYDGYEYTGHRKINEQNLRPLTKKEAGR